MTPKNGKRSVTLYNLIFPVFLIFSPLSLLMLPFVGPLLGLFWLLFFVGGNLGVDWLVTALAMRWQKIPEVRKKSLAVLVRVWLAGYAADILSALFLFVVALIDNDWIKQNIEHYLLYTSIYESPWALALTLLAVALAGLLIYWFNMKWSLQKVDLTEQQRKRTALTLAVLTAPWLFLLPTRWFY